MIDAPKRACVFELTVQADTHDEMVRALENITRMMDRREMTEGCSGGVASGWVYRYTEADHPTNDEYVVALRSYLTTTGDTP